MGWVVGCCWGPLGVLPLLLHLLQLCVVTVGWCVSVRRPDDDGGVEMGVGGSVVTVDIVVVGMAVHSLPVPLPLSNLVWVVACPFLVHFVVNVEVTPPRKR
ncbi:hypothetical protein K439DRAFT_1616039 [Ramaria rubella]|nr:hypothetical protein K439DRAFT_1616039 [Ramaria rubella]